MRGLLLVTVLVVSGFFGISTQTQAARSYALIECSTDQVAERQLNCGRANIHRGSTTLRFLRRNKQAGTTVSRHSVRRSAKYLIRYGTRHVQKAQVRIHRRMPYIDGCLREIIRYEGTGFKVEDRSTWYRAARKPNSQGSGAYGIPQALPGSKMASAGADWATNPVTQIRWMIGYVNGRYGGSCSALSFHRSNGYY